MSLRFVGTQDSEGFTDVQIEYVGLLYKQGIKLQFKHMQ